MAARKKLRLHQLVAYVRFVEGYRYLDKCGEFLVRAVNGMDSGWAPGEVSPQRGILHNFRLGMTASVSSEAMSLTQNDFLSFDHFASEASKLFELAYTTFSVERIIAPSIRVIYQVGFEDIESAEKLIVDLELYIPSNIVTSCLHGERGAFRVTQVSTSMETYDGVPVQNRKRLEVSSVRQERQAPLDRRVFARLPILDVKNKQLVHDLLQLRRNFPAISPAAAQFDFEMTLQNTELEARRFSLHEYLESGYQWTRECQSKISTRLSEVS